MEFLFGSENWTARSPAFLLSKVTAASDLKDLFPEESRRIWRGETTPDQAGSLARRRDGQRMLVNTRSAGAALTPAR